MELFVEIERWVVLVVFEEVLHVKSFKLSSFVEVDELYEDEIVDLVVCPYLL